MIFYVYSPGYIHIGIYNIAARVYISEKVCNLFSICMYTVASHLSAASCERGDDSRRPKSTAFTGLEKGLFIIYER